MRSEGLSESEVLLRLGDYYTQLNSSIRRNVSAELKPICDANVKGVVGEAGFDALRTAFKQLESIQQLTNRYMALIGALRTERQRQNAERVGLFCKKLYGLSNFDPGDLTSWLSAEQKREVRGMMKDPDIGNDALYTRLLEFYEQTTGDRRNDAREVIETGCKWFIGHMLGEDVADSIEEQRASDSANGQMLSAQLVEFVAEIKDDKRRIKTQRTLPICERIYLQYGGECFCNAHSSVCDPHSHRCLHCADHTAGIQCERCAKGYVGSGVIGGEGCSEEPSNSSSVCHCHGHSQHCDANRHCLACEHNTTGGQCERCDAGYYGDATEGTPDDCHKCPCREGEECFVNEDNLLECGAPALPPTDPNMGSNNNDHQATYAT